jgi:NACHT domain
MSGDDFRDRVAKIIKARYGHAFVEYKVGGKDADIAFNMRYPGGQPIRIAVECKDWGRAPSSEDLNVIYSGYMPAFNTNSIDSLWVVSSKPIRGEQAETVASYGIRFRVFTLESLYNEIIDFSPYLGSLVYDYKRDGLNEYYIMPRSDSGLDLHHDIILPWLNDTAASPIALVAGYGAGKTSYAKFLANFLGERALRSADCQKPIVLQLGNLTTHQNIRSLCNSLFVDEFNIDGYNYNIFRVLLEQGAFVIIFDGFDEMKHAMRRRDIIANFSDIHEFMKGTKSRYLLFGRPDPFISAEDELPLRSKMKFGTQIIKDPTKSEFLVIGLDEFNEGEVELFLEKFIRRMIVSGNGEAREQYVSNRLREIRERGVIDLVKRPVHARMLGVLAASPDWKVEASSECELYAHFVSEFVRREVLEKKAREPLQEAIRIDFMVKIAWWLWTKIKRMSFTADEVPRWIISEAKKYFDYEIDEDVVLRELLVGSIYGRRIRSDLIVEKQAFSFYFPHRSYWEFLVAEYIASAAFGEEDVQSLVEGVSPQIVKFLRERIDRSFVPRLSGMLCRPGKGNDLAFLVTISRAFSWTSEEVKELLESPESGALAFVCAAAIGGELSFGSFCQRLERLARSRHLIGMEEAIFLISLYCHHRGTSTEASEFALGINCRFLLEVIDTMGPSNLIDFTRNRKSKRLVVVPKYVTDAALRFFNECVRVDASHLVFNTEAALLTVARDLDQASWFSLDKKEPGFGDLSLHVEEFLEQYVDHRRRDGYRTIFQAPLLKVERDGARRADEAT